MKLEPLVPTKIENDVVIYPCGPVHYVAAKAGRILADHTHDEAEILWIISGSGEMIVANGKAEFTGPQTVHIPAGVYHKFLAKTDVNFIYAYKNKAGILNKSSNL